MAKGVAEHLASTILEAEGTCYGNPGVQAGKKIVIGGVAEEFAGEWIVTAARHDLRVRGRRAIRRTSKSVAVTIAPFWDSPP